MGRDFRLDDLLNEIGADLLNGKMKSEVIYKLMNKMYESQVTKYNEKRAKEIMKNAINNFQVELKETKDNLKAMAYNRLLSIYESAVSDSDRANALKSIDLMNKMLGLYEPDKLDVTGKLKRIVVKFGVGNQNDEDDEEEINDENEG